MYIQHYALLFYIFYFSYLIIINIYFAINYNNPMRLKWDAFFCEKNKLLQSTLYLHYISSQNIVPYHWKKKLCSPAWKKTIFLPFSSLLQQAIIRNIKALRETSSTYHYSVKWDGNSLSEITLSRDTLLQKRQERAKQYTKMGWMGMKQDKSKK